jgi:hypothetical protein
MNETPTASVYIGNTGDRKSEEAVQLYILQFLGSNTRSVKELKVIEKIRL